MTRCSSRRGGALVALLLSLFLLVSACANAPGVADDGGAPEGTKTASGAEINRAALGKEETESSTVAEATVSERTKTAEATKTTVTASEEVNEASFVHRAGSENIGDNSTYIDHPLTNGDPNAFILVKQAWERRDDASNNGHEIGVWYSGNRGGKWAIFNQDLAPMSDGTTFKVSVLERPEKLVHRAASSNTTGNSTYIDNRLINDHPDVGLSITSNWNPGGGDGTYNDHPAGIRYDDARGEWAIYNKDGSAMPDGAAFNVAVTEAGKEDARSEVTPKGFPEYRHFYSDGDPETPAKFVSSGSSAGAIPPIKPFNFGRDPGGPEDRTLYLSVSKLGLDDVPVFDTVSEEKLRNGTVHIPATGYPWQEGANVFIAGHRVGYTNTPSHYVFFRLDELAEGDEILLEDSDDGRYVYRVTRKTVVGPDSVEVMNPIEGESLVTLQTCTLPDYKRRLIIQGELVEKGA